MMKRFLIGMGIALVAVFGAFVVNSNVNGMTDEMASNNNNPVEVVKAEEVVNVVEQDGFKVLDVNHKEDYSTIVVKVNSIESDEYVTALNVFDDEDEVVLDKEDLKIGDIVLVTFEQDDVVNVEKNTLNIENVVVGQEITK